MKVREDIVALVGMLESPVLEVITIKRDWKFGAGGCDVVCLPGVLSVFGMFCGCMFWDLGLLGVRAVWMRCTVCLGDF